MSGARWEPRPRAPGTAAGPRHEVVVTDEGAFAIRDLLRGEVMHPVVGPAVEAEVLYVGQSRLRERLRAEGAAAAGAPLVLYDAGLGAASNALAAWRASEALAGVDGARPLELVSFEQDLGALEVALAAENAEAFGLTGPAAVAARALLARGEHETPRTRWRLHHGELLACLGREPLRADVVFWDPFSPRANPELWTCAAFTALRDRCAPGCGVFTYAAATSVRSALFLGGFAVGVGLGTGTTRETTAAATDVADLAAPLGPRWLQRLRRSSAPFPADAPPDALRRLSALPQLRDEAGA